MLGEKYSDVLDLEAEFKTVMALSSHTLVHSVRN